jgi:hypothetical protein
MMKKLLFVFTLLITSSAFADVIIHNDSDETILVNIHVSTNFIMRLFSESQKALIKARSIGKILHSPGQNQIDYISFHIQTGPFKGIGGRLDLESRGYQGALVKFLVNRLYHDVDHIITLNIKEGMPSSAKIEFLGYTVPPTWWKVSHTPEETAHAQEILRDQMVTKAACENISN